jgi:hypothetical protein
MCKALYFILSTSKKKAKKPFFNKNRIGRQNRFCLGDWYQWERGGYKERV